MESSPEMLLQMICSVQEEDERLSKQIMDVRAEIASIKEHIEDNKNKSASTAAQIRVLDKEIEGAEKELQCERFGYLGLLEIYKEEQHNAEVEEEALLQAYHGAIRSIPSSHPHPNATHCNTNACLLEAPCPPLPLDGQRAPSSDGAWPPSPPPPQEKGASGPVPPAFALSSSPTHAALLATRPPHETTPGAEKRDDGEEEGGGGAAPHALVPFPTTETAAAIVATPLYWTLEAAIAWVRKLRAERREAFHAEDARKLAAEKKEDDADVSKRKREDGDAMAPRLHHPIQPPTSDVGVAPMTSERAQAIRPQGEEVEEPSTAWGGGGASRMKEAASDRCGWHPTDLATMVPLSGASTAGHAPSSAAASVPAQEAKRILSPTKARDEGTEEWPAASAPPEDGCGAAAEGGGGSTPRSSLFFSSASAASSFSVAPRQRTIVRRPHTSDAKDTTASAPCALVPSPSPFQRCGKEGWTMGPADTRETLPPPLSTPCLDTMEERPPQDAEGTAPQWDDTWLEGLATTSDFPWTTKERPLSGALASEGSRESPPLASSSPPRTRRKQEKASPLPHRRGGKTITFVATPELEVIRRVSGKNPNRVAEYPTPTPSPSPATSSPAAVSARRRTTILRMRTPTRTTPSPTPQTSPPPPPPPPASTALQKCRLPTSNATPRCALPIPFVASRHPFSAPLPTSSSSLQGGTRRTILRLGAAPSTAGGGPLSSSSALVRDNDDDEKKKKKRNDTGDCERAMEAHTPGTATHPNPSSPVLSLRKETDAPVSIPSAALSLTSTASHPGTTPSSSLSSSMYSSFGGAASASRLSQTVATTTNRGSGMRPYEKTKSYYSGTQLLEDVSTDYYSCMGNGRQKGAPTSPPPRVEKAERDGTLPPAIGGGRAMGWKGSPTVAVAEARGKNVHNTAVKDQTVVPDASHSFPAHTMESDRNPLSSRSFSFVPRESASTAFPSSALSNPLMQVEGQECVGGEAPDRSDPPSSSTPSSSFSSNAQHSFGVPPVSPITAARYGRLFTA